MKKRKENSSDPSRRQFLKHLSLGFGASVILPSVPLSFRSRVEEKYYLRWRRMEALPEKEKLGVALVGLGNYATGQLGPALRHTKLCRLSGVVTGTPAKEKRWGEEYDIPESHIYNYDNYDTIVDDPEIDIIYIVLPNGMHAEYTIRAAAAGKHVICEKPMATSVEDCRTMIEACRASGRKLSLGYRLHFEPHNEEISCLGQEEVFGPVESIEGRFAINITGAPDAWRLDRELAGGGALMDVGIYVVQAANYVTGELPVAVTARKETSNREIFSEVEENLIWETEFPGGIRLNASTGYSSGGNRVRVEARNGSFGLEPAFGYGGIRGETGGEAMDYPPVNQQMLQMDAFASHLLYNTENRIPGEMGLRDMKIMTAMYESAETGQRVTLSL